MLHWIDVIKYARYATMEPTYRVEKSEEEWKQQLTPTQYQVMREKGTEPPYRNAYCRTYDPGRYACAGCGQPLFDATTKYHAISGWPSFTQPITRGAIRYAYDFSHRMERIEALCNRCGCHLGHVFPDGPEPGGLRYCINSVSLVLIGEGGVED
ncbi:peptide-methionine (R)-S-oxide reductase MsrB [Telluribacter sp. SYSU D00476]|uniref:peptide-methionine (R)-S-oxide reductase MsrB n=1 Tax=Telluribacter sp. SYSU D00476 TaxID=2811430 RepID=UPI001FF38699|nr:peptide-methionine (R)-S-oxide reductase MsrB [Telluribacter sp. SYSU D00476]